MKKNDVITRVSAAPLKRVMSQVGYTSQGGNGPVKSVPSNPVITEKKQSIMPQAKGGSKTPSSGGNHQKPTTSAAVRKTPPSIQENRSNVSNQVSMSDTPSQKDDEESTKKAMKRVELEEKRKQMREDMKKKKKTATTSDKDFTVEIFTTAGRAVINEEEDKNDSGKKYKQKFEDEYDTPQLVNYVSEKNHPNTYESPPRLHHKAQSVEAFHYPTEYDQVMDMPLKKGSSNKKSKKPAKEKQDHSEPPRPFEPKEEQASSPRVMLGFGEGSNKNDRFLNQDYSSEGIEIYVKGAPPPRKPAAPLFPQIEAPVLDHDFRKKEERHEFISNDEARPSFAAERRSAGGPVRMERQPSYKDDYPRRDSTEDNDYYQNRRSTAMDDDFDDGVRQMVSIDRTKKILKFLPEDHRTDYDESMEEKSDPIQARPQSTEASGDADNDFGTDLESVSRIDTKKTLEDQLSSSYAIINVSIGNFSNVDTR